MKKELFETGCRYTTLFFPDVSGRYICPLCLRLFGELNQLTLEHVPPKSIGGVVMCLTCRECNNAAGGISEGHLHKEQRSLQMMEESQDWQPAKLDFCSGVLNVRIQNTINGINVVLQPANNNPDTLATFREKLSVEGVGSKATLSSAIQYDVDMSDAGYLKSAYLALFSKLGYYYILCPALNRVREQISNPSKRVLCDIRLGHNGDAKNEIWFMRKPIGGFIVRMGLIGIPMPSIGASDSSVFHKLYHEHHVNKISQIEGGLIDWPDGMEMCLDVQIEESRRKCSP